MIVNANCYLSTLNLYPNISLERWTAVGVSRRHWNSGNLSLQFRPENRRLNGRCRPTIFPDSIVPRGQNSSVGIRDRLRIVRRLRSLAERLHIIGRLRSAILDLCISLTIIRRQRPALWFVVPLFDICNLEWSIVRSLVFPLMHSSVGAFRSRIDGDMVVILRVFGCSSVASEVVDLRELDFFCALLPKGSNKATN
jgi:hypothetical protein